MSSEDLGVWLWITPIPGDTQQNRTFTSQYSEQKHLSKATRPWWTQAAADPWGPFVLTPDCYRCLQPLRACSETHGLHSTRAGQRDDPKVPHMRQDPPPASAKLIWGLGLKCQSVEQKAVFLGSRYWGYTPFGPGFGDKEPVTHGVIFKVLPHYLNQQHKHEMTRSQVLFPQ